MIDYFIESTKFRNQKQKIIQINSTKINNSLGLSNVV